MSETSELTGSLLGADVWAVLAHEYLTGGRSNVPGVEALGAYVCDRVEFVRGDLCDFYRYDGVRWWTTAGQPYDGLADLSVDVSEARVAAVSTDYCDHPVWSPDTNVRFRIWHDTAHVRHGLGFGVDDELRLFVSQAREIDRHGVSSGRFRLQDVVDALFCESVYQLAAFVAGGGRYPEQQFVVSLGPVGRAVQDLLFGLV